MYKDSWLKKVIDNHDKHDLEDLIKLGHVIYKSLPSLKHESDDYYYKVKIKNLIVYNEVIKQYYKKGE